MIILIIILFKNISHINNKMGLKISKILPPLSNNKCNYDCPNCQKSGKEPNIAGRFFIINDLECKCNACDAVFPKEKFYKTVVEGEPVKENSGN